MGAAACELLLFTRGKRGFGSAWRRHPFVLCWFIKWAVLDAVWSADVNACRKAAGACWGFVTEKWRLIIFGRFPYELQWRPALATFIIVLMLVISAVPSLWSHRGLRMLLWGWVASFAAFFVLMIGGIFGLEEISTDMWGGLPLTVILTLLGMAASSPLGILLAIGRRSRLPIILPFQQATSNSCAACR